MTLPVAPDPALSVTARITGATDTRLLVSIGNWTGGGYYTGTPSLAPVPGPVSPTALTGGPFLVGDTAVWAGVSVAVTTVHRTDLVTGTDAVESGGTDRFLAAGATSWVGSHLPEVAVHSGGVRRVVLSDVNAVGALRADDTSAVVSYTRLSDLTSHLDLVDLATGAVTPLLDTGVLQLALTPASVVWTVGTPRTLVRYDRATGTRTSRVLDATLSPFFAATDAAVAYGDGIGLRVAPADPAAAEVAVTGSGSFGSLVARGSGFAATRDGASPSSGLWAVSAAGAASKLTGLPVAPERYSVLDLDNDRVVYAGGTQRGTSFLRPLLRVRDVAGQTVLGAGPESTLPGDPASPVLSGTRRALGSLTVGLPIDFVDGTTATGRVAGTSARISGPYAVVDGTLPYRVDGTPVALPVADGTPLAADVYGSRFVYLTTAGVLRLLDAASPVSATNPRTLATNAAGPVAVVADTVGYAIGGTDSRVLDLRTGSSLAVPGLVAVGDGVAVTASGTALSALDLETAVPVPVPIGTTGASRGAVVDDHRVAWIRSDGAITVARLPFGGPHRPRLLGLVVRSAFSPDADGSADTWLPQIDLSKPVPAVTVTLRSGTTVVRTLHGTAPVGSVRDVVWDGRTDAGTAAPDGTYTWTLTGDAADGDGALAGVDGVSPVTGTVVVDRVSETAAVSVPAASALVRTTDGLPVSWKLTSPASRSAVVYDLRWRPVDWDFDRNVWSFGPAEQLRTGTRATAALLTGSPMAPGEPEQFSVRARDAAGNVGPWSPWRTGVRSEDDRDLGRTLGPWAAASSAGSFLGTTTTSTVAAAQLSGSAAGSRLYVWTTTCPTCGELEISANDTFGHSHRYTVDTRSATTRRKVLVLDVALPRRHWFVELWPAGTPGRPRVHVDAIGSAW